jgi:hypothetical protein
MIAVNVFGGSVTYSSTAKFTVSQDACPAGPNCIDAQTEVIEWRIQESVVSTTNGILMVRIHSDSVEAGNNQTIAGLVTCQVALQ